MRQLGVSALGETLTESFDRLCSLAAGPVCLAISGGGDSMALFLLASDWAQRRGRALLALTVDHGLRPEAAAEARFVAEAARRLGVEHRTLKWALPVPGQAKARKARHDLLSQAAIESGSGLILTAHTEDDQAETFLIRARAGSGWYGLAGIQPLSLAPADGRGGTVMIGRPLLGVSRVTLRTMLQSEGQDWVEDPSNENPTFERVRMRRRLAGMPELRTRILVCRNKLQLLRQLQDRALARWLREHVEVDPDGSLHTDVMLPAGECGARALAALIALAADRSRPLRSEALARLAGQVTSSQAFRPATLGGAIVSRKGTGLRVVAEKGLVSERVNVIAKRLKAMGTAYSGGM